MINLTDIEIQQIRTQLEYSKKANDRTRLDALDRALALLSHAEKRGVYAS
jgi:hypothetical protein